MTIQELAAKFARESHRKTYFDEKDYPFIVKTQQDAYIAGMTDTFPMDTAPKDGTIILITDASMRRHLAYWSDENDEDNKSGNCYWANDATEAEIINPVSWRPLP